VALERVERRERAELEQPPADPGRAARVDDERRLAAVAPHGAQRGLDLGRLRDRDRAHLVPLRERGHEAVDAGLGAEPRRARRELREEEDGQARFRHEFTDRG
jgi:hypothetical protein